MSLYILHLAKEDSGEVLHDDDGNIIAIRVIAFTQDSPSNNWQKLESEIRRKLDPEPVDTELIVL